MSLASSVPSRRRQLLWTPPADCAESRRLNVYRRWLRTEHGLCFDDYPDLWKWSATELDRFWLSLWEFFDIRASTPPHRALKDQTMPGAEWFPGTTLNWAENILRRGKADEIAIIALGEDRDPVEISWAQLRSQTASLAAELRRFGVKPGDRVAGYLPNIPAAVVGVLAAAAVGAIWVVCPPEYGTQGVLDRLQQVEPAVLIAADGYRFGGADIDRMDVVVQLRENLPTVRHTIVVRQLNPDRTLADGLHPFDLVINRNEELVFEQVPFGHPLWILYSSGTTGLPKGIVHSHGGILLEHLKAASLHLDVRADDRVFIYTSTAWMLWNMLVSHLAIGATIITYDGSPAYPGPDALFAICADRRATRFGTGAAYLAMCERVGLRPGEQHDLSLLRGISSTGSPLPESTWHWVYEAVGTDLHLSSDCGGTDVCSAFIGANPLLPVYAGELQAPYLGVNVEAWSDEGVPVVSDVGEMVITAPMPSMPVRFWADPDGTRYHAAYFDHFPGIWRHGDWLTITEHGTFTVHGRSDSTLNRGGVRMGSSDIYSVVEALPEVTDSLVVGVERPDGTYFMPLFVVLSPGMQLDGTLRETIAQSIRLYASPRHVPDEIHAVPAVPRTVTGKKLEVPIKRILQGVEESKALNRATVADPASLDWYLQFAASRRESDVRASALGQR